MYVLYYVSTCSISVYHAVYKYTQQKDDSLQIHHLPTEKNFKCGGNEKCLKKNSILCTFQIPEDEPIYSVSLFVLIRVYKHVMCNIKTILKVAVFYAGTRLPALL